MFEGLSSLSLRSSASFALCLVLPALLLAAFPGWQDGHLVWGIAGLLLAQVALGAVALGLLLQRRWLRPLEALDSQLQQARCQVQGLAEALEKKNDDVERLALYDHLTGLPNRQLLGELFAHHAAASRRHAESMALLVVDLDGLQDVSDALGRAAADELIVETGRRLQAVLRQADVVCRVGGSAFLALLPRVAGSDGVANSCERVLQAIDAPMVPAGAFAPVKTSISLGVAMYPGDGVVFDELARMAELAAHVCKQRGRARYSFYQPALDHSLRQRLSLEHELRSALGNTELQLHYQPIYDARQLRVVGCEALLRWQHPSRGLLLPDDFLAVAAASDLICEIDLWALRTACRQFAQWRAAGAALEFVAVNVSALQAHDARLPQAVSEAMRAHGMRRGELELELTEGALMSHTDGALRTVNQLRSAGAVLVLDDFGTGYSSLSTLKLLTPDKLKIDRSFVCGLPSGKEDCALTQAVIAMAHNHDIVVVAEGVESIAQHDWLLKRACVLQQGHLHGHAMLASELEPALCEALAPSSV